MNYNKVQEEGTAWTSYCLTALHYEQGGGLDFFFYGFYKCFHFCVDIIDSQSDSEMT